MFWDHFKYNFRRKPLYFLLKKNQKLKSSRDIWTTWVFPLYVYSFFILDYLFENRLFDIISKVEIIISKVTLEFLCISV